MQNIGNATKAILYPWEKKLGHFFSLLKFIYSEKATKFWLHVLQSKVRWRFRKILWPSYMNFKVFDGGNIKCLCCMFSNHYFWCFFGALFWTLQNQLQSGNLQLLLHNDWPPTANACPFGFIVSTSSVIWPLQSEFKDNL